MLDWPRVSALPWKARRAAVEAGARAWLAEHAGTWSTKGLAEQLAPKFGVGAVETVDPDAVKGIASELVKLSSIMGKPWATHDGEAFIAYGRRNLRWRWHGQAPYSGPLSMDAYTAARQQEMAPMTATEVTERVAAHEAHHAERMAEITADAVAPLVERIADHLPTLGGAKCITCGLMAVHKGRCTACGKR